MKKHDNTPLAGTLTEGLVPGQLAPVAPGICVNFATAWERERTCNFS